ncbi:hypothetical protein K438DRAFT_1776231 [Mycena galopus ATCC 62051]|nr:hypothetical protein K438DRAFT_1776231 [Mycena galopus ATCC 62051]
MQRKPQAYQTSGELLHIRNAFATDILRNVNSVTSNRIHRNLTPPTIRAQTEIHHKFTQFVDLLKQQGKTEFDQHNLPHAFDTGAALLPLPVLIAFINYICLSSKGVIQEQITVVTLQNKIGLFLGLTTRLTGNSYASQVTRQLYAYADGAACEEFDLSRDVRIKPVADQVDVSRVLEQLWKPTHSTKSTRMRYQIGFCIKKAAASGSRPGQDVESSKYRESNEAFEYRDLKFLIIPKDCPVPREPDDDKDVDTAPVSRARLVTRLSARLQKGKRNNKKNVSPFTGPGYCAVTDLAIMAMLDQAFTHVPDFDTLHRLMENATKVITLQIKDKWLSIPVLRAYSDSQKGIISPNKALKYSTLYTQYTTLGVLAGFEEKFGPYCLRRMAANEMDSAPLVSSAQRTQTMGHNQFSRIFQSSYINQLVQVDLSAVAAGRQEDRVSIKMVGRMSMNADTSAPIAVSPEGLKHILQITEVKTAEDLLDQGHLERLRALRANLSTIEADTNIRSAYKRFRAVFARHQREIFHEERQKWFNTADERLLQSLSIPSATNVIEPITILPEEDEEQDLTNLDMRARISKFGDINFNNLSPADLEMLVREGGYTYAMHAQAGAFQQALSEGDFDEFNFDDILGPDCTAPVGILSSERLLRLDEPPENVEMDVPTPASQPALLRGRFMHSKIPLSPPYNHLPMAKCPVTKCKTSTQTSTMTFEEFGAHIIAHHTKGFRCKISSCDAGFTGRDELQGHIEQVHGIPPLRHGFLQFCYWCHSWFLTADEYNQHREQHFTAEWEPHRLAIDTPIPTPIEERPVYALDVNTGLIRNPGICPFSTAGFISRLAKKKGTGELHPIQRLTDLKRSTNAGPNWVLYGSDWADELTPPPSASSTATFGRMLARAKAHSLVAVPQSLMDDGLDGESRELLNATLKLTLQELGI